MLPDSSVRGEDRRKTIFRGFRFLFGFHSFSFQSFCFQKSRIKVKSIGTEAGMDVTTLLEATYSISLLHSYGGFTWTRSYCLQRQVKLEVPHGDLGIYLLMFGLDWWQYKQCGH